MGKIDIVYVLGTGTGWDNNEIRFSLRSIHKNLSGYRNIYLIGEKPEFLTGIHHYPYPDDFGSVNADGNIINKILHACQIKDLSENFLFINDDHIILKPLVACQIPPYYKFDLKSQDESYFIKDYWRKRLLNTFEYLQSNGHTTRHHDCHTPIILSRTLFQETFANVPYQDGIGFTMKSIYANLNHKKAPILKDHKKTIFRHYNYDQLQERLSVPELMSFNDMGINNSLKIWLIDNFPEMSKYETSDIDDKTINIYRSLYPEYDPELARECFLRYTKGRHLKQLVQDNYSEKITRKIQYKLSLKIEPHEVRSELM